MYEEATRGGGFAGKYGAEVERLHREIGLVGGRVGKLVLDAALGARKGYGDKECVQYVFHRRVLTWQSILYCLSSYYAGSLD